jgi:hypothetical protein
MYRSRALIKTGGRCAVTNSRVVDACHVVPRAAGNKNLRALTGEPDITVDDAKNLICLNPVLHRLFDAYRFSFAPLGDGFYIIEPYVSDPLLDVHLGKPIRLDACGEILEIHRRKCREINTQSGQRRTVQLIGGNKQASTTKPTNIHLLSMSEADGVVALRLAVPGLSDDHLEKVASQQGILKPRERLQIPASKKVSRDDVPITSVCISEPSEANSNDYLTVSRGKNIDPPQVSSGLERSDDAITPVNIQQIPEERKEAVKEVIQAGPSRKKQRGSLDVAEIEAWIISLYPTISAPLLEDSFAGFQNKALALAFKKHGNKIPVDGILQFLKANEIPTKNWKANAFVQSCGTIGDPYYIVNAASQEKLRSLWVEYISAAVGELAGLPGFLEDLFKEQTVASEYAKITLAAIQVANIIPMSTVTDALRASGVKTNNYGYSLERKHMRFLVRRSGDTIHGITGKSATATFRDFEKEFQPYLLKIRKQHDQ